MKSGLNSIASDALRVGLLMMVLVCCVCCGGEAGAAHFQSSVKHFVQMYCIDCHDADSKKGNLDLTVLNAELSNVETLGQWVKVYDRIRTDEMPPKKQARPSTAEHDAIVKILKTALVDADEARFVAEPRTGVRRMTRAEYENTMRDLFDMPGMVVQDELPADGSAHGFDRNYEALDISHVNVLRYMEAADHVLNWAIVTQPAPPVRAIHRVSLANEQSPLGACILDGDGVMLKNKQPDPDYPPAGLHQHISYPAHLALNLHRNTSPGASVGVFRHEDESFKPSFAEYIAIYPGMYKIRTSFWSFLWDKGKVLPNPKTLTARLDVWHITGDGRGTSHPNSVLGYFDAPSINEKKYEIDKWLNTADSFGFNFTQSGDRASDPDEQRALDGIHRPRSGVRRVGNRRTDLRPVAAAEPSPRLR